MKNTIGGGRKSLSAPPGQGQAVMIAGNLRNQSTKRKDLGLAVTGGTVVDQIAETVITGRKVSARDLVRDTGLDPDQEGDIGQGRGPMKREDPALEAEIDQGVIPLSGTAAADVDALILVPEELVETTVPLDLK